MVRLRRERLLALDATSAWFLDLPAGLGRPVPARWGTAPLAPGTLEPAALERNIQGPGDLRAALHRLAEPLPRDGRRVTLVLPDGVARLLLLEAPAGVQAGSYARYRMGQVLPFPVAEAAVATTPAGAGRMLAAAVRRQVVEEYETAVAAAGFEPERVDLAPLLALDALRRRAPSTRVEVVLGDVALCLALCAGDSLQGLRNRRRDRDEGEGARLAEEIARAGALDVAGPREVGVVGPGAASLCRELQASGLAAAPAWDGNGLPFPFAELSWWGAALV